MAIYVLVGVFLWLLVLVGSVFFAGYASIGCVVESCKLGVKRNNDKKCAAFCCCFIMVVVVPLALVTFVLVFAFF